MLKCIADLGKYHVNDIPGNEDENENENDDEDDDDDH
jgi:hypothetical protein